MFHGVGERVAYRPALVGGGQDAGLVKSLDSLAAAKHGYGIGAANGSLDGCCFFCKLEGYEL